MVRSATKNDAIRKNLSDILKPFFLKKSVFEYDMSPYASDTPRPLEMLVFCVILRNDRITLPEGKFVRQR